MIQKLITAALIALLALQSPAFAASPKAKRVKTDVTNFDNNLSAADTNVQLALDTLDEAAGGTGDHVTVNASGADTTANFLDGTIDFSLADGGAGGPDDITATLDPTAISGKADTTIVDADYVLFWDATDSALKKVDAAELTAGGAETNSLETLTTGIATTEIPIGTAADTVVYAALSGDATMANNGVVTVVDDLHAHVIGNVDAFNSAALAGQVSDETGSGLIVFNANPTFEDITLNAAGVKISDDGDGALTFLGLGNGFDENLIMNLDDVTNEVTWSSSTGVATWNFSAMDLQMTNGQEINTKPDGTNVRTILKVVDVTNVSDIQIGHTGTALIDDIIMYPGATGVIRVNSANESAMLNVDGVGSTNQLSARFYADGPGYMRVAIDTVDGEDSQVSFQSGGTTEYSVGVDGTDDSYHWSNTAAAFGAGDEMILTTAGVLTVLSDITASGGDITLGSTALSEAELIRVKKGTYYCDVQSAKLTGIFVTQDDATQGAGIDAGEGGWKLLFDDTTDEGAVWQFIMPSDYDSADAITATIIYSMASAIANEVEFEVNVMAVADGEQLNTASFDTTNVGSVTVPVTAGLQDTVTITLTNKDSVAAEEMVFIQLSTDANDATNDDATGDREVYGLKLTYGK